MTAAVRAAREGRSVALLAYGDRVGGMTTAGLGTTDVGHPDTVGGLARAFYAEVAAAYEAADPHWDVEAHVAEDVFARWLAEAGVRVVRREAGRIAELATDDGHRYRARVYVDASYEGDMLAAAGVSYTVGWEASTVYGESLAGVQAYNFRLHVTTSPHRIPFPRPEGYDPARYELLRRYVEAGVYELFGRTTRVRGDVFDVNNHGAFSSDHIGANYDWPEADHARREEIFQDHVRYQAGLLHFLANDQRLPVAVRTATREYGLAPGEFADSGHWPHQIYVREARRMVAEGASRATRWAAGRCGC